jgi:hypothetical protein
VEAVKMKAIQSIRGSQYLQNRPGTAARNNIQPAKATGKMSIGIMIEG